MMFWHLRHLDGPSRRAGFACAVVGMCLVLLAGCGGPTTQLASSTAPTSTHTTSGASKALAGCPGPTQAVAWPTPPATVIQLSGANSNASATVPVGQSVLIELSAKSKWALGHGADGTHFTLDQPAGYGDTQNQSCDWHLTATSAGTETLGFAMSALCTVGEQCPQYLVLVPVTLTATA